MNFLARCSAIVRECCRETYPNVETDVTFEPSINLALGDATTRICQQLGAKLRISPLAIRELLAPSLNLSLPGVLYPDDLVSVRIPRADLLADIDLFVVDERFDTTGATQSQLYQLLLPPPHGEITGWPYVRLCVACLWQAALQHNLGIPTLLVSLPPRGVDIEHVTLLSILRELIRLASDTRMHVTSRAFSQILMKHLSEVDSQVISQLWLSTRSLPRADFRSILNRFSQSASNLQAHFPEMDWFVPWDEEASPTRLLDLDDDQLLSFVFYLMRPLNAVEIDLSVPGLNENANTLFWIRTMERRIERIFDGSGESSGLASRDGGALGEFEPFALIQPLMVRLRFFSWFLERAARVGEVREFFLQLDEFLARSNRYLNEPQFRRRLENAELSARERNFVTGLHRQLSLMIRISSVWQEKLRLA